MPQRHPIACAFLKRRAKGCRRSLQPRGPTLPLPKPRECEAEVHLDPRPGKRHPTARAFLKPPAKGRHRHFEPRRPPLPLPEPHECEAEEVGG